MIHIELKGTPSLPLNYSNEKNAFLTALPHFLETMARRGTSDLINVSSKMLISMIFTQTHLVLTGEYLALS